MKRINYLAIILLLVSVLTACSISSTGSTGTELNPKLEDLNYFCDTLEKKHKNLYANISKEEFEIEKEKIAEKTEDMSHSDFYYSLKHLLSMVADAHTNIAFVDSQYKYLNALGFAIGEYSDGWHLLMLEEENKQYLGCKLIGINDMEIKDVFSRSKEIMSYENEVWAEKIFSNTINFRDSLEYLGVVEKGEPIVLKIEDNNGNNQLLEFKSMNEQEVMDARILTLTQKNTPKTIMTGIYSAMPLDKNCFYIQYNSCQEDPDLSMEKFVSSVIKDIKENNYNKIIIDLRYNSGGNSRIFEPMISELSELQKDSHFKIYTIIGKDTFSSAIINAIQIKKQLDAILVGTPTGGNVNGYGELKKFTLKNTPIFVWYSTKYFELIKGYEKDSLYPDIYVEQNFQNYLNGIDSEVDMILKIEE